MNSNQKANQIAIKQYRKELESMLGDICEIDIRILNKALNVGLRDVKKLTTVGVYTGHVSFDTNDGKHVEFDVTKRTGGTLRRNWNIKSAKKLGKVVQGSLYNNTEYAPYVNYGHRIINKSGETIGWVKGRFMLEKSIYKIEKTMEQEFKKEVERVNREHGS